MHTPFTTTCPTAHKKQFAIETDPTADDDPAGHEAHAFTLLAPVTDEYDPAEQFVHALTLLAPVSDEYAPAGHETHALALVASVAEYVPTGQDVQIDS